MVIRDWLIRLGFLLAGLAFTVVSIVILCQPKKELAECEGEIVEISESYNPASESTEHEVFVDYEVNGTYYEHAPYFSYDSSMELGGKVTVLYDPDDPSQIQAPGFEIVPWVTLGAGVLVTLGTVISFFRRKA